VTAILARVPWWIWLLIIVAVVAAIGNALHLWTIRFDIGFGVSIP
jgi:hypothetical protein